MGLLNRMFGNYSYGYSYFAPVAPVVSVCPPAVCVETMLVCPPVLACTPVTTCVTTVFETVTCNTPIVSYGACLPFFDYAKNSKPITDDNTANESAKPSITKP